ncbi:S66 peptidase family protein [Halovenus rubra]|uniref:S66 peptidase family protein n=2 Tax=Halovenus rubra TaxID=869890 RepID=A0ACC7DZG9_9EURY|nr:S66 peptidase family protein [Halovenus rubra]
MIEFVTPPKLHSGEQLAIIAPSSGGAAEAPHILELGKERLESRFGIDVTVHPTARQSDSYLREHPKARAAAIHEVFKDSDIGAVMATIGGDDQLRVLDYLDPEILRSNPTRFFGLSDNTNLSLYLWNCGIVSYNGLSVLSDIATPGPFPEYTEQYLERALFEESLGELEASDYWFDMTEGWDQSKAKFSSAEPEYHENKGWRWAGAEDAVTGRLWGGCLAIVRWHLMSDRYLQDPERLDGAVLALETAETLPDADRVRWFLMAMGERGLLQRFDGVMVGRPATEAWFNRRDESDRKRFRQEQREAILSQVNRYNPNATVVLDVDFGHTNPGVAIPIGGKVTLEPGKRIVFK